MAWDNESMIKAIEGALEREKAEENNSGIIGISFQIAEKVLIPLLRVKVIKCKDCRHGDICTQSWNGVQYVECHAHEEEGYDKEPGHALDWYCADAELKIDEDG